MATARFRAMASPCEVLVQTTETSVARLVSEAVLGIARHVEDKWSRYREDNIVARINRAGGEPTEVDEETANLLDFAARIYELSDGQFDITSGVLRRAWTFDGRSHVPSAAELAPLLALVGWHKATWQRPLLTLLPGMQIDFGGIGKEYAVDQAVRAARNVTDDPLLVNFGGDLAASGPRSDGSAWRIGIEPIVAPTVPGGQLVDLSAGALATSGDTYRYVNARGERLSHILDPRSGMPVRGAPRSITVAAPSCTQAGMLTTMAMLKGRGAEEFLRAEGVRHWIQRS
ncbi:MAG TPA: FAD:protein FMN transferase [Steroidobacteraceae bacterium]|jgi:thiamine biosynthesis lipoprotein